MGHKKRNFCMENSFFFCTMRRKKNKDKKKTTTLLNNWSLKHHLLRWQRDLRRIRPNRGGVGGCHGLPKVFFFNRSVYTYLTKLFLFKEEIIPLKLASWRIESETLKKSTLPSSKSIQLGSFLTKCYVKYTNVCITNHVFTL